ncbi:MAG: hypothetical protein M3N23_10310 [Pseudomonadota bacterium]|nr:hypothetical protein [Pseudomonadota bacterium]
MRADVMIEIVVVLEKASGHSKVVYVCDIAPADAAMDMFVAESTQAIALYHHSSYDAARQSMKLQGAMRYPGSGEKMILVGQVRRYLQLDTATQLEVSRAPLRLKDIPIDEW